MTSDRETTDTLASSDEDETGPVQYTFDSSERPAPVVVEAVATATDRDPANLPPLHDYVDSDALNALVDTSTKRSRSTVRVSFTYAGTDVFVDSEGEITVSLRSSRQE